MLSCNSDDGQTPQIANNWKKNRVSFFYTPPTHIHNYCINSSLSPIFITNCCNFHLPSGNNNKTFKLADAVLDAGETRTFRLPGHTKITLRYASNNIADAYIKLQVYCSEIDLVCIILAKEERQRKNWAFHSSSTGVIKWDMYKLARLIHQLHQVQRKNS